MTLYRLKNIIENIVNTHPHFRQFNEGSVYDINDLENINYPLFNFHINYVQGINESNMKINVNFIYLDRLINDFSNKLLIQSDGIVYLNEVINSLDEYGIDVEAGYQFTPFTQSVNDVTAGVYVTLNLQVTNNLGDCNEY